jgi:hypothetical protein
MYFWVFGVTENNSQIEIILGLTKKSFFSFEKWFSFLNFVNHFSSLIFSFSNHRITVGSSQPFLFVAHFPYEPNAEQYFQKNR